MDCPSGHANCTGLWAIRCGAYKAHYVTASKSSGYRNPTWHNPPLIFAIEEDPSE